jgi:hypothetical protein
MGDMARSREQTPISLSAPAAHIYKPKKNTCAKLLFSLMGRNYCWEELLKTAILVVWGL